MRLEWETATLALREPFRISRSVMDRREAVWVSVEHEGLRGHGEVVASRYRGLDVPRILAALGGLTGFTSPEDLLDGLGSLPAGVRAGVDAAVHDLLGKRSGLPVYGLLGRARPKVPTAYTIGLDQDPGTAAELVSRGFTLLKLKLGKEGVLERVAAARAAAPDVRLLLDPNGAWTPGEAVRLLDGLVRFAVEAVEQPIPPGTPDDLARVSARSPIPVVADEDAATLEDVRRLAGAVHGVNVKLTECGGIRAAEEILRFAEGAGLDVLLGCQVGSSLGVAPAVHLAGAVRWADLDGHLLLAGDPWTGLGGHDGTLRAGEAPGLGVRRV
ncbi:dipeptide epimerase [Actinocorallia sp. B10E7]|uniref:dipeptide epimerase n=1 Tax=Actinocorallia sp. B10E7 TaxID=3153558 RepID=UPI00325EC23B